jgi:hypothetical protein
MMPLVRVLHFISISGEVWPLKVRKNNIIPDKTSGRFTGGKSFLNGPYKNARMKSLMVFLIICLMMAASPQKRESPGQRQSLW